MRNKTAKEAVELTPRQSRFVDEYLLDPNATQAAVRSGYSERSARSQGQRLLTNAAVLQAIQDRMAQRSKRTQVDADYVLHRLHDIDQLDIADILDDTGNMLAVSKWPKAWRQSITGLDLQEIMSGDAASVVRKIKWPDKLKTLELMGKHVNVKAFEAEKESAADDLATALAKLADKLPG